MKRGGWNTRFGFYLVAIGSAFGLGSLWRFPFIVQENGGGGFVALYLMLVCFIGTPLLIGELLLGKSTRSSVIAAFQHIHVQATGGTKSFLHRWLPNVGRFSAMICVLLLAYYSVVSGWVLYFVVNFVTGGASPNEATSMMSLLSENGWMQVFLTSLHLLIVVIIVAKEVEDGIERWVGYMMPIFVVLLLVLTIKALSMNSNREALQFFLYPDFGALNISSLGSAVGHVLFTLSLGFGTMVTFGSYLKKNVYIPTAGFRVATLDSMTAIFAGLLIFPLVMASTEQASGPELLFKTLPVLFAQLPGGVFFGFCFFVCLYLAALGASIAVFETIVASLMEDLQKPRARVAVWAGVACFLFSFIPALSSSVFKDIQVGGRGVLEFIDLLLINWIVPIIALIMSQIVCYRLNEKIKRDEIIHRESPVSSKLYSHWIFVLQWVAPAVIVLGLFLQVLDLVI